MQCDEPIHLRSNVFRGAVLVETTVGPKRIIRMILILTLFKFGVKGLPKLIENGNSPLVTKQRGMKFANISYRQTSLSFHKFKQSFKDVFMCLNHSSDEFRISVGTVAGNQGRVDPTLY